jgi:hypothetical protein
MFLFANGYQADMRGAIAILAACACAAMLTACGSSAGATHPQGWTTHGQGASAYWTDPGHASERFSSTSAANPNASLKDLASQVTTDTLLRYRGARLLRAEPFPPCPGEAGWQSFAVPAGRSHRILHVAFTQWNGTAKTASYERPADLPDDPSALTAMGHVVCATPI